MSEHVVTPVKTYVFVFVALLVGTLLTVLVSEVDLGWANNIAAMSIAIVKALLVLYFFMELRHSTRMSALTAIAGFFWLVLMLVMIMMDYWSRHAIVLPVPGK
ncbi:MAG TPA: cytochrome C oxidase subunit IV family protein [Thermoanaerobaculia bacterium]|jgi:cytochrome c oxidase subunit 4|nr:cytochrome C oxidase subunit IV family protein [Thermoanaerobaculia bacterium]